MVIGSRRLAVTHPGRRCTWSVSWRTLALVGDIGTGRFITGIFCVRTILVWVTHTFWLVFRGAVDPYGWRRGVLVTIGILGESIWEIYHMELWQRRPAVQELSKLEGSDLPRSVHICTLLQCGVQWVCCQSRNWYVVHEIGPMFPFGGQSGGNICERNIKWASSGRA